ncbi:MAG: T9SS type A sorting domain-containing protein [bacterium]
MKNIYCGIFLFIVIHLLIQSNSFSQLSGAYTIGQGGNFNTITSAVYSLVTNGINGPATFNIIPGIYDEQVVIDSIPGTSEINNVVFQSQSGISNSVIWQSTLPGNVFILNINSADYLSIKKLSFDVAYYINNVISKTIVLTGNCQSIIITDNNFSFANPSVGNFSIVGNSFSRTDNLLIKGNIFSNSISSDYGIGLNLTGLSSFTCISSNSFTKIRNPIKIANNDSMIIEKNNIKNDAGFVRGSSIHIFSCNGSIRVSKNTVRAGNIFIPGEGLRFENCFSQDALVSNNFFDTAFGPAIICVSSNNIKYFYNTIFGTQLANNLEFVNSYGNYVRNNIIVNLSGGFRTGYPLVVQGSTLFSDYNNFYYFAPYFGKLDTTHLGTLQDWINATGNDTHSKEVSVQFANDFHLAGSSIGDTSLAGIPIPEVSDDIDGDTRSAIYPYMGADEANILLPVLLTSFNSSVERRNVTLIWNTSFEENNSGFSIERTRSNNGMTGAWEIIGFVNGNGTTSTPNHYSFIVNGLNTGYYKFRLKQIDFNGNSDYYYLNNEVYVGVEQKYQLSQNYPNPFNPVTKIDFELPNDGEVSINIFDMSGREIMTIFNNKFHNAGFYTVEFNGEGLSTGVYFYEMKIDNFREIRKMVLVK